MLTIGDKFPSFDLKATVTLDTLDFPRITEKSYPGKWLMVFFYPKDFTFVCPPGASRTRT